MKLNSYIFACAVSATLVGCGQGDRQTERNTGRLNESQPVESKQNTPSPTPYIGDFATEAKLVEEKNATLAAAEKELKACNAGIEELAKKAASYVGDAKVEAEKALAALHEKSKTAADKCEQLKQSSRETWQQVKDQFNAAMSDFKRAIEDAASKFSS